MPLFKKLTPFYYLSLFYLLISFVLRTVLMVHPITQSSFSFLEIIKIYGLGLCSDVFVFIIANSFLWLYLIFISNSKYNKPSGYIIFGLQLTLLAYVSFGNTILDEYGGALPKIGIAFIGIKTVFFGLFLFLPQYRERLRLWMYRFVIFLYVLLLLQNGISEYFFWNEFGVKYNFIAVNYLIYTNEVIGNIMESYPVIPIFSALFVVVGIITFFIVRRTKSYLIELPTFKEKIYLSLVFLSVFTFSFWAIPALAKKENSTNIFTNELQSNGIYKFYLAFMNSELDYFKFYKTLPKNEAYSHLHELLPGTKGTNSIRTITSDTSEVKKNVVLITIESLSADFMKRYGNEKNITPFLDSLADKSLEFTNLYAVGNRTVRGLAAVTLCLPPTAGESVVKRKDNKNKFTTAYVFKKKGYKVNYLYGGDAFFDNMESFFGGNGYTIIDKKSFAKEEITFSNVWGVCDEDMAKKAIQTMNADAKTGKPFFSHWMTVSNHRPFTYPNNKIDIPGDAKSREGGVKYTDYALKQFFKMAKHQSWFKNTLFVIVADHCASSAGKIELPLNKYRIPAFIYDPNRSDKSEFNKLMSQIDIMPTVFGLLHFDYKSKFYGQDVLKTSYQPRAFIATYQDLGLIKDSVLTILSPKQKVKQFDLKLKYNKNIQPEYQSDFEEIAESHLNQNYSNETITYYQTASEILKNKQYQKEN
ncbi:LTA synthase family protein [Flavobacterium sp. RSSA_27]|uniref:LTA synthase family protein n=1 Tax=Flavobacterium sp. RSSA_27 TaxID=3447667 RepID=UPI003F3F65CA